jgi:hypothetical protein
LNGAWKERGKVGWVRIKGRMVQGTGETRKVRRAEQCDNWDPAIFMDL